MKRYFRFTLILILLTFLASNLSGCLGCIDLSAPTVVITSPSDASTISGIVIIKAEANDDVSVAKVEFYIDGSKVGESTNRPYIYEWDTSNVDYGTSHTIQAKAYDNKGRIGESSTIRVVVADHLSPTVMITDPQDGSTVSGTVTIQAEAIDRSKSKAPSGIQKVEFYIDGNKVGEDNTSPYTYTWNTSNLTYGSSHTIQAKAYDNANRVGTSPAVTVVIGDTDAPMVVITNPIDGSTVSGTVTIQAEAIDRSKNIKVPSGIKKVDFYIDGVWVSSDTTSPYTYSWNTDNLQYGSSHTIKAKAYDNTNIEGISPEITVTIGDSVAPTITITSPQNGSVVSGRVIILAFTQDRGIKGRAPSGIEKVEFYVDGELIGSDTTAPYSCTWDTNNLQYNSTHILLAKAYDNAGNIGESSLVTVTIGDDLSPTVMITDPQDGSTVSGTVTIQAEAIDRSKSKAPSGIQKVEFYIDGNKVGEDNTSPYTYTWNTSNLTYGSSHTIQAKAYDNAGKTGTSQIIVVTIGDTLPPIIVITNPKEGEVLPGSAKVTITADVQDRGRKKSKAPSNIQKVEFYLDSKLIGTVTSIPYECILDTSGLKHNSIHTITVKAYDTAGKTSESSVNVTINVEWTVFMYLDGHNDLYQDIANELNLLNNVSSTAGINILVLVGLGQTDPLTSLYYFHNGTLERLAQYYCNFGNPDYLREFLNYGIQNYPAKRYMVVIKGQGSGWRNKTGKSLSRDICWDGGDSLTIPELRSALYYAKVLLGRKIDFLFLDASFMGTIEVDYDVKDLVNYLVSSETTSWYGNTRWDSIFNQLALDPTISADALGVLVAQTYFDSYTQTRTIAVKDLSKVETIVKDIYDFARYLRNYVSISTTNKNIIKNLRSQTQSFTPYEYIDLYQFAELIKDSGSVSDLNLLNSIAKLIGDIGASLLYLQDSGYPVGVINGYSIWFPETLASYNIGKTKYEELLFTNVQLGNEWKLFLEEILAP